MTESSVPEMVERVARALCIADRLDPDADWRNSGAITLAVAMDDPRRWRIYERKARAAIEAFGSPTIDMINVIRDVIYAEGETSKSRAKRAWQAGIDAALGRNS